MSAEIVAGIVAVVLALVGGAAGWFGREQHGAETERRKQAEARRDAAEKQLRDRARPEPTSGEYLSRLQRAQARLARLRGRAAKR